MKCSLTVFEDSGNEWRWQLQAGNHRVIADSGESYRTKGNAVSAAKRLVKLVHDNRHHLNQPTVGEPAGRFATTRK